MMGLGNGAVERAQRPKPEDAGTIWGVAESLQRQQPEYIFEKNKHFVTLSSQCHECQLFISGTTLSQCGSISAAACFRQYRQGFLPAWILCNDLSPAMRAEVAAPGQVGCAKQKPKKKGTHKESWGILYAEASAYGKWKKLKLKKYLWFKSFPF